MKWGYNTEEKNAIAVEKTEKTTSEKLEELIKKRNKLEREEITLLKKIEKNVVKLKEDLKTCRESQRTIKDKIRSLKKQLYN